MVHAEPFLADFVSIFVQKFCVIFAFKAPIYVMQEDFHLSCRGSNKAQKGSFISSHSRGGRVFPRFFFEKWKQMVYS